MVATANASGNRWASAWPDALAFVMGLLVARWAGWNTGDLVWSLWLSSLVVGYCMILWGIFGPQSLLGRGVWHKRSTPLNPPAKNGAPAAVAIVGGLFMLGFFTVHFGGFHLGHSVFLNLFFPVLPESHTGDFLGVNTYLEVVRRYWIFLPMAFLAERAAFTCPKETRIGYSKRDPESVPPTEAGALMFAPYKNVVRLHLLIFFFAGAHFLKLENFAIYAVVYAVYFFPWRLVFKRAEKTA
ncbi:MAG: DUF6498-containing protein [Rariglobus sp.]